ncbi:hypothetical protein BK004_01430 [bacterium CG10_46_32]|nr:MAG: hypothetical protein BK004_01430 [bacterium CG10_46_32]PIR56359.1 MAG: hypothetical protein COU73_01445 [Parcubacteria group bacterium CG10_big_fil_rev_8_21_14_0_10_46_32]
MDIDIRYVKKNEVKKLVAFNKAQYRPGHILTNKRYLDWQFGSLNALRSEYTVLGVFDAKENLLGTFGFTFLDFLCFGKKVTATSCANLMVNSSLRNMGLGYALLRKAQELHRITLDHGLNADALRLFLGMGWSGGDLNRHAFIVNSAGIKKIIKKQGALIQDSTAVPVNPNGLELVALKKYDVRLEALFKKTKSKYPITVARSKKYLNWRYFKHPLITYSVFVATKNGKFESFVVVRMEGSKQLKAGRIVDFISTDSAEAFSFAGVVDFCRIQGAHFIDYYFSGNFHVRGLARARFVDCSSGSFVLLPKFLNPVVVTEYNAINMVVCTTMRTISKKIRNINNWYTTKGGGDQDRAY